MANYEMMSDLRISEARAVEPDQPKEAFWWDGDELVIPLSEPVQSMGQELRVLRLRKPRGKDYRKMQAGTPFGMAFDLAASLAAVPPSTIDNLCGADVLTLVDAVTPFLGGSQLTGAK